jgi:2-dehydro-3-deoxygluconokinase
MVHAPRIRIIGEGMLELARADEAWRLGYGGDTLNTAIHLARFGLDTAYITALGADAFSGDLRDAWAGEGLDVSLILTDSARMPGLYAVRTDTAGERSFSYWRGDSAARRMFDLSGSEQVVAAASTADLLCYSLITLAILPEAGRERLFAICDAVRARGGKIAFDGNYRATLWPDVASARVARNRAIAGCDIGLPTLDDEIAIDGGRDAAACAARWRALGAREVTVKLGARGCLVETGEIVAPPAAVTVVDTSGAGDAFNAGYLHARLAGADVREAALGGHRLAGWTITRPGAIPARTDDAPYGGTIPT